MSTQQLTLDGGFQNDDEDDENDFECPLCGSTDVTPVGLPDHIASDDCDTEHKEIRYD